MKRFSIITGMIFLILTGCAQNTENQSDQPDPITPVEVARVIKGDLQKEHEIFGRAIPGDSEAVIPKISGELTEIHIQKGDVVEKGQLLARVDPESIQNQIELQQIAVTQAQTQLDQAISSKEAAETALDNARDQRADAEENVEQASDDPAAAEAARQQLKQAENAVSQAEQNLEQAEFGVEQARIQLQQAQTQLQQTKSQMETASITAGMSGIVTEVNGKEGGFASNTQPFATIISLNPIKIQANIGADELPLFQDRENVAVYIYPLQQSHDAAITYISPVVNDSGMYTVEAELENKNQEIKPGMMAGFQLPQTTVKDQLLVPTSAVVEQGESSYVFMVENDRAVQKQVKMIETQTEFTAIEGDLKPGDQVVTKGQLTLSDGNKVQVMKEAQQ